MPHKARIPLNVNVNAVISTSFRVVPDCLFIMVRTSSFFLGKMVVKRLIGHICPIFDQGQRVSNLDCVGCVTGFKCLLDHVDSRPC